MESKRSGRVPAAAVSDSRSLVHPQVDAWLVGGFGIVAWLALSASAWGGPEISPVVAGPFYWILLALSGTHFGASYHLAYGQGREVVRERWLPLVAVPAVLLVISVVLIVLALGGATEFTRSVLRVLLTAVFTSTGWHYVKQTYGIARVGASLRGLKIDRRSANVLRYGLYPIWFVDAVDLWTANPANDRAVGTSGYQVLPTSFSNLVFIVALGCAVVLTGQFIHLWRTWGQLPPPMMWVPYILGYLWFLFPPSYLSLVLVLGAIHGLQYLACAHRAEVVWGAERDAGNAQSWWLAVFGGAFATGMLLVYWLPEVLTNNLGDTTLGTLPATLIFVGLNLHHYAVDASIWRSRDDHIRRIVKGPDLAADSQSGAALAPQPEPALTNN